MSAQAGEPYHWVGIPYRHPDWWNPYGVGSPSYPKDFTGCRPLEPITEDRIREIIREELRAALESLKETSK